MIDIIQRLRRDANVVPGIRIVFQPIQNINIGGRLSKAQYQYTLQSNDTDALYNIAPQMRDKIAQIPGLFDVDTDLYIKNPQMTVDIDRAKAAKCSALVLTLDLQILGQRHKDLRNGRRHSTAAH